MFGRATIRLGIGPHSSFVMSCDCQLIIKETDDDNAYNERLARSDRRQATTAMTLLSGSSRVTKSGPSHLQDAL